MLESYLKNRLQEKEILLMTHIVLGYPTFEDSFKIIESMVNAGVDLMELQIPFSEPIADGPVILNANQKSLSRKTTVKKCMDFAQKVTGAFDVPFLFMSYYNILFKYGVNRFTEAMAQSAIKGAIVPDLPPEEGRDYLSAMEKQNLVPIFIFSPTTPDERMKYLASFGKGLAKVAQGSFLVSSIVLPHLERSELSDTILYVIERHSKDMKLRLPFP